jgi:hypothetical protein
MARKTSKTPTLTLNRVAHKRTTYLERTRATTRAAQTLTSAVNGRGEEHWTHDDIRSALLRVCAVEIEELVEELPRAAILHAVTKGWIHRAAGQGFFRVTKRAATELKLPAKNGSGQKIAFLDATKLPPSLPAFEEKTVAPDHKECRACHRVLSIADAFAGNSRNHKCHDCMQAQATKRLEPEYQNALTGGTLTERQADELARAPAKIRAVLFAAFQAGKSVASVRKLAAELVGSL